jgi:endonuclease/exonuclease/phosphatase family metal-dependent hydrolase
VTFRVHTWNCFGMGQSVFDAITAWRAPAPLRLRHEDLESACSTTHLLCVQELLSHHAQAFFDDIGRKTLVSRFRDHNRPGFRPASLRGTGLGMASRSPLLETRLHHFRAPRTGWDMLARKGILHARVALPEGPTLDVITTHLQAGYDDQAIAVRAAQLTEVARMVEEVAAPHRPFIVCGDFNIDGLVGARDGDEYRRLTAALPGFRDLGADEDLATFDPHPTTNALAHAFEPDTPRQRLDYVFFRPAVGDGLRFVHTEVEPFLHRPFGTHEPASPAAYASDHFGVCATFEY